MTSPPDILAYIRAEQARQHQRWPRQHPVSGWLLVLRRELDEACEAWATQPGDAAALHEILQVVACGLTCLEQHGLTHMQENEREKGGAHDQ